SGRVMQPRSGNGFGRRRDRLSRYSVERCIPAWRIRTAMTWWQALSLGVVEGLTEYLPVSSTGHLILVQWMLGLGRDPAVNDFNIVIQAGAIAAVARLYRARLQQMARGLVGRDPAGRRLLINLVLAFVPAAVLGPLLAERIAEHL